MGSSQITIGGNRFAFVHAEATDNIFAVGQVYPRVQFELRMRTNSDKVQAELHYLKLRVVFANEVLGEGTSHGDYLGLYDHRVRIEVPMTRTGLGFVAENLQADRLDLTLSLSGWMRIKYEGEEGQTVFNEPPGEWHFQAFGGHHAMADISLQIARGDWFKRVLEPFGTYEYVLTEIPVLRGLAGTVLQKPLAHIKEAERHFAEGNDPAVFSYCRAMIESLPGWPKEIFSGIADQNKAKRLDEMTHAAKQYYDHGRHLAHDGEHEGDFPVNHREALFAINMAKVLLAETAAVLGGA
jgi:hypothetical protein